MMLRADPSCSGRVGQLGATSTNGAWPQSHWGAVSVNRVCPPRPTPSGPDQAALNTWSVSIGAGNAVAVKASRIIRLPSKTTCQ